MHIKNRGRAFTIQEVFFQYFWILSIFDEDFSCFDFHVRKHCFVKNAFVNQEQKLRKAKTIPS